MSDADRNYLLSSGRLDAPDGSVSIMLPKNDRATESVFADVQPAPTAPDGATPATPPPAGQPAIAQADQAAARTVPDSQTEAAAVGALAHPRQRVTPTPSAIAEASIGAYQVSTQTGYTADEVIFMRVMGMNDKEIIDQAAEEHFMDPQLLQPPKNEDRVIVPRMAHQAATITDASNPAEVEVMFDNGMKGVFSEDEIFHEQALKFSDDIAPSVDSNLSEGQRMWRKYMEDKGLTDEEKAEFPDLVEYFEGAEEARRIRAAERQKAVEEHKQRQAQAEEARPSQEETPVVEEEGLLDFETDAAELQEVGREVLDPATEGMVTRSIGLSRRQGGLNYGMISRAFSIPVSKAKEVFAEVRNRGWIDREGHPVMPNADIPGPQYQPGETPPVKWVNQEGVPIHQLPLNEYLLQGLPPELATVRNMRINSLGFANVTTRTGDLYVKRVGDIVRNYLPERQQQFDDYSARHKNVPGSVPLSNFDQLLSERHDLFARIQFANEMEATGESRPLDAAMAMHRRSIREAIAGGIEIPAEVLENYPDMQKAATETAPLTSTSTNVLNKELKSRGFTWSQAVSMNPQSKEWIVANNINPREVAVLENGQVVMLKPEERPENNPKNYLDIETPSEQVDMFNEEMGLIDRLVQMFKESDPEAGFLNVPGGDAIVRLRAASSRMAERIRNSRIGYLDDVMVSLEGAINKWAAEHKLAELEGEWAVNRLNKIIKRGVWEAHKTKKDRFNTPEAELEMATRYMDDPDFYAGEYNRFSEPTKQLIKTLQDAYQELWSIANQLGILDEWRANYVYRLYKDSPNRINNIQYGVSKKQLAARAVFSQKRKYNKLRDAEAAGLRPILDPIMLHRAYIVELAKTSANYNLINTLMGLETENGLPAIMARPHPGSDLATVYNRDYVSLPVQGLQKWVYVRKIGGKPGFVRVEAKATPALAKRLTEVFDVTKPPGGFMKAFLGVKAWVMRLKLLNPAIHGANIMSDYIDEFNFRAIKAGKAFKSGRKLFQNQDALVVEAVRQGLNLQLSHSSTNEMRRALIEQSRFIQDMSKYWRTGIFPLRYIMEKSDQALWGFVRDTQISMWVLMRDKFMQHNPTWSSEKAGLTAAVYVNTNLGTLPAHWMKPWARKFGSIFLFARNWTFSNLAMFSDAATKGRIGLGLKALDQDARHEIGRHFAWHLFKGWMGLLVGINAFQIMMMAMHNQMVEWDWKKGAKVKVRPTFMNESPRHYFDVWIGKNNRQQNIYLVPHFFRYIRDYIGLFTDPVQTGMNKMDVFVRFATEKISNYQAWSEQKIIPKGAEGMDKIRLGFLHFAETMLPMNYWAKRPGREPTLTEWVVPFSGTWLRRGTPGGKMGRLYYDYLAWRRFQDDKLDKDLAEAIQSQDWKKFAMLAAERYKTPEGRSNVMLKYNAPSLYMLRTGKDDLPDFNAWLKRRGDSPFKKTYSVADFSEGAIWEVNNFVKQLQLQNLEEIPSDQLRNQIGLDPMKVRPGGVSVPPELRLQDIYIPPEQRLEAAQ
jgi:hypothetical protein